MLITIEARDFHVTKAGRVTGDNLEYLRIYVSIFSMAVEEPSLAGLTCNPFSIFTFRAILLANL